MFKFASKEKLAKRRSASARSKKNASRVEKYLIDSPFGYSSKREVKEGLGLSDSDFNGAFKQLYRNGKVQGSRTKSYKFGLIVLTPEFKRKYLNSKARSR